jgi:hypothetical protein
MGKTKLTALERVNSDNYENNFYELNEKMYCIACKSVVNHARKSVIDKHLTSASHIRKENLTNLILDNITQPNLTKNKDINLELTKAFVEADIPLEKINKLHNFLKEFCNEGKLNIY